MIGLIDLDLQQSSQASLCPPNIEIMKLAAYYKKEENKFCRLVNPDETNFDGYEMIYVFSESDIPQVPPTLYSAENITFGGTGFTNRIYIPFNNSIIDYTLPRINIYSQFLKEKYTTGTKTKIINHLLDDTYYRHYAGEEELPIPPIIPRKRLILYDREFFRPGWERIVDIATERRASSIVCIHPIYCKNLTQLFSLRQRPKIARSNTIILDIDIPLEDVSYMLKKYTSYFLADVTSTAPIYLQIGGTFKTNLQQYRDLVYKLNLLYSFWSKSIPIRLKYIPPLVGVNNSIKNLLIAIDEWSRSPLTNRSINEKISRKTKTTIEQSERDLVLKFHPSAAELFNQTYDGLSTRRRWNL